MLRLTRGDALTLYRIDADGWAEVSRAGDPGYCRAAYLCDALPNIDFVMSCAHPTDIEPARSYLESYKAMVTNTTKS